MFYAFALVTCELRLVNRCVINCEGAAGMLILLQTTLILEVF